MNIQEGVQAVLSHVPLSSRTEGPPRAYSSHGNNRDIKDLSKDYILIQLSQKAGREMRIPLAYLVHVIRVERLPQKLPTDSLGSSSARNGSHVQLSENPWKRARYEL